MLEHSNNHFCGSENFNLPEEVMFVFDVCEIFIVFFFTHSACVADVCVYVCGAI